MSVTCFLADKPVSTEITAVHPDAKFDFPLIWIARYNSGRSRDEEKTKVGR